MSTPKIKLNGSWVPLVTIPTNVSAFTNDAGYITSYTETDPTVPSWAKQSTKPTYTAQEVGALPSTTSIPSKTSDLTNDVGYITGIHTLTINTGGSTYEFDGTEDVEISISGGPSLNNANGVNF